MAKVVFVRDFEKRKYFPKRIPDDVKVVLVVDDLDQVVPCASCYKDIKA